MPYVRLEITPAATRAEKAEIVRRFTQTLGDGLGKRPEHIHVVIDEVDEANRGFAGQLTDEWRKGGVK